jgi:hypothetical protein
MQRDATQLEAFARELRQKWGIEFEAVPDLCEILEVHLADMYLGFRFRVIPDGELHGAEAFCDAEANKIEIKQSVYEQVKTGNPRARMILTEEIGHRILGHKGVRFRGAVNKIVTRADPRIHREETEAKKFAAIFLAPSYLADECWTATDIQEKFHLSRESAEIRVTELESLRRRSRGEERSLPQFVVDFLKESKKRGYRVRSLDD